MENYYLLVFARFPICFDPNLGGTRSGLGLVAIVSNPPPNPLTEFDQKFLKWFQLNSCLFQIFNIFKTGCQQQ